MPAQPGHPVGEPALLLQPHGIHGQRPQAGSCYLCSAGERLPGPLGTRGPGCPVLACGTGWGVDFLPYFCKAASVLWLGTGWLLLLVCVGGSGARWVPWAAGAALWHMALTHHAHVCQFASKADKPPVEIYVADEWNRPEQAVVKYKVAAGFHRSSWDWIGLYRVGACGWRGRGALRSTRGSPSAWP